MIVSWRHMLAGASFVAIAATALTAVGQQSHCGTCAPPPSPPPPPPSHNCCQTPSNLIVNVPGVNVATANVNVGATSTVVAAAGVSTTLSSGVVVSGGASGGAYFGGGGGGYYSNAGVAQSSISDLAVDGGYETKTISEDVVAMEDYCIDKEIEQLLTRPVEAICVDDKNTPHPASRVDGELSVDETYNGEVYRCIAGTHMQVTMGTTVNGAANFDTGESFSCAKGEALWHGKGGALTCRPQTPERNCNERSLLRKYGPGVKLVKTKSVKKYCEPAQRQTVTKVVKEVKVPRPIAAGNLVLDGGVGQGY